MLSHRTDYNKLVRRCVVAYSRGKYQYSDGIYQCSDTFSWRIRDILATICDDKIVREVFFWKFIAGTLLQVAGRSGANTKFAIFG